MESTQTTLESSSIFSIASRRSTPSLQDKSHEYKASIFYEELENDEISAANAKSAAGAVPAFKTNKSWAAVAGDPAGLAKMLSTAKADSVGKIAATRPGDF
jgi:hypothetical protein